MSTNPLYPGLFKKNYSELRGRDWIRRVNPEDRSAFSMIGRELHDHGLWVARSVPGRPGVITEAGLPRIEAIMNQQFVGFGLLEDLIGEMATERTVNVECISEDGKQGSHGLSISTDAVITSQVIDGEVLYHYWPTARYQMLDGKPLTADDGQSLKKRSQSGYQLVLEILKEKGFNVIRRALVAFPRNYKLLHGSTNLIRYDKESDLFKRAEVPA